MKNNERDPGLQPERTSMSWLRTHMLMFGLGALLTRVGKHGDNLLLMVNGFILLAFAFIGLYYSRKRFTQLLRYDEAVEDREIRAKKILSAVIAVSALIYAASILFRYFY
jgi:uncharacterized membrane protein YidH (DUF202 family)